MIADLCGAKSMAAGGCSSLAEGTMNGSDNTWNPKEKGVLQI